MCRNWRVENGFEPGNVLPSLSAAGWQTDAWTHRMHSHACGGRSPTATSAVRTPSLAIVSCVSYRLWTCRPPFLIGWAENGIAVLIGRRDQEAVSCSVEGNRKRCLDWLEGIRKWYSDWSGGSGSGTVSISRRGWKASVVSPDVGDRGVNNMWQHIMGPLCFTKRSLPSDAGYLYVNL